MGPLREVDADGSSADLCPAEKGDRCRHDTFIVHDAPAGESPVVVFSLEGGIDDYAEALAERGVEIVVPVSESPDGGLSLDFVDPDRNMLSLHQGPESPRRKS